MQASVTQPQPDKSLVEAIIAQIEVKQGCLSREVGFLTDSVELNPDAWNRLIPLGELSIHAEYGQNPDSGCWSMALSVKRGRESVLELSAFGGKEVCFRDADYMAPKYIRGEWEQRLLSASK